MLRRLLARFVFLALVLSPAVPAVAQNVTRLNAKDRSVMGTYPVGNGPVRVVFDGTSVWVANFDSNSVTKLRAKDGKALGTFPVGPRPVGVAFDGTNIWVSSLGPEPEPKP